MESQTDPSKVKELAVALATSLSQLSEQDRATILFIANGGKALSTKPDSYISSKTRAPYYGEKYAISLQRTLDKLLDSPRNTIAVFKTADYRLKKKTLQNRIFLSWAYLINYMDTEDKKYMKLRNQITVRDHPEGIALVWKRLGAAMVESTLQPEFKTEEDDTKPWKKLVDRFLDEADENDKMDLKVNITQEDVRWLETYLSGSLDTIVHNINCRRIVIIKNKDLARAVKSLGIRLDSSDLTSGKNGGDNPSDSGETSGT